MALVEAVATTVPGIEDFALIEAIRKLRLVRGYARLFSGHVYLAYRGSVRDATTLRTVEKVGPAAAVARLSRRDLGEVVEIATGAIRRLEARYGGAMATWGVACERAGRHGFTSLDVEREVGASIKRVINLVRPDVEVRVDVAEDEVYVWAPAKANLRDRPYRRFRHESAINPVLAHAMAMALDPKPGETICDPTCGSGTLLAETHAVQPSAKLICMDIVPHYAQGATLNVGWAEGFDALAGDATRPPLRKCDAFIMNPPYGIRMRRPRGLYESILRAMAQASPSNSRAIVIAPSLREFKRAAEKAGWVVLWGRPVYQGGRWSWVISLRKSL